MYNLTNDAKGYNLCYWFDHVDKRYMFATGTVARALGLDRDLLKADETQWAMSEDEVIDLASELSAHDFLRWFQAEMDRLRELCSGHVTLKDISNKLDTIIELIKSKQ